MELVKSSSFQSLKLATMFLASLLSFSVMFSYSSSLVPIIFNFVQYFSSNVDKNHMFLLCNGILVLIVKNAGLMGNSYQESDLYSEPSTIKDEGKVQKEVELSAVVASQEKVVIVEEKQVQETEDMALFTLAAGNGKNASLIITQDMEDEQTNELEVDVLEQRSYAYEEEEEEEEEEAIGLISTEELNKKCDDFIRMMKGIKH